MYVTIKEEELVEKDKEIKELKTKVAELEDKDWYEACIKQLEEQNNKLIKEIDDLRFEKRNVFGLIEKMEIKFTGGTKEKISVIRRQLCSEIKTLIAKEYDIAVEDMPKHYHRLAYSVRDIYELLDKIIKGDEE